MILRRSGSRSSSEGPLEDNLSCVEAQVVRLLVLGVSVDMTTKLARDFAGYRKKM